MIFNKTKIMPYLKWLKSFCKICFFCRCRLNRVLVKVAVDNNWIKRQDLNISVENKSAILSLTRSHTLLTLSNLTTCSCSLSLSLKRASSSQSHTLPSYQLCRWRRDPQTFLSQTSKPLPYPHDEESIFTYTLAYTFTCTYLGTN